MEVWKENYEDRGRIFQRLTYTYKAGRTNSEIWVRTYSPFTSEWTPWVISGGSGLTDNVKVALLSCFRHVLWVDEHGQDYYDALSNALFPDGEPDERIVYELAQNTNLASMIVDTNQHAFTLNEDFTILAKASVTPSDTGMFLLDSQSVTGAVVGVRMQSTVVNGALKITNQFDGGIANSGAGGGTSDSYSLSSDHDVIFVMRNNNKTITIKTYVDGVLSYEDIRTLTLKENTYPATYYIGKNHAGTESPWDGTVDIYRIYNEALSDAEINEILGITPDEKIAYEITRNTDISTWNIDTGKHAYTADEDFTFLAKVTWNPSESGAFLLDSQSTTGEVVGARIQSGIADNNTNVYFLNQFNGGINNSGAGARTTNVFSASVSHTVIYVMRNNNKFMTIKTYIDGNLEYEDSRTLTAKENTWPETYYIGMNHGNQIRPWDGIIDLYRIYNEALSDSEINSILGLNA